MLIAVVGVCASGKSTLVRNLKEAGFNAYNVVQEHSCIKRFWNRWNPDLLVMIDASLGAIKERRDVTWNENRLKVQHERLRNAKENADLYILTDSLSKEEVLQIVINFIRRNYDGGNNFAGSKK